MACHYRDAPSRVREDINAIRPLLEDLERRLWEHRLKTGKEPPISEEEIRKFYAVLTKLVSWAREQMSETHN